MARTLQELAKLSKTQDWQTHQRQIHAQWLRGWLGFWAVTLACLGLMTLLFF